MQMRYYGTATGLGNVGGRNVSVIYVHTGAPTQEIPNILWDFSYCRSRMPTSTRLCFNGSASGCVATKQRYCLPCSTTARKPDRQHRKFFEMLKVWVPLSISSVPLFCVPSGKGFTGPVPDHHTQAGALCSRVTFLSTTPMDKPGGRLHREVYRTRRPVILRRYGGGIRLFIFLPW